MTKPDRIAAVFLITTLCGCATLNKEQCMQGDWRGIGYQDGSQGMHSSSRIPKHIEACSEYSVSIDHDAYHLGWNEGIRNYCTTFSGFNLGNSASAYNPVCPAELESDFIAGYRQGLDEALQQRRWQYDENEDELHRYYRQLAHSKDKETHEKLEKEIKDHEQKHDQLEDEIEQIMQYDATARGRQLTLDTTKP